MKYFCFIFSGYATLQIEVLFYDDIEDVNSYKREKINGAKHDYFFGILEDPLKKIVVWIDCIHYIDQQALDPTNQLSNETIEEVYAAFGSVREVGEEISTAELGSILRSLGQNPTEAEIEHMIVEVDPLDDGTIDFHSFLTMWARMKDTD